MRRTNLISSWSPDTPNMKKLWFEYYSEMEKLFRTIMIIFARVLEVHDEFFLERISEHGSSQRIVFYPPVPQGVCACSSPPLSP
jgi:isopenicillin N synthase-like dioxygenase